MKSFVEFLKESYMDYELIYDGDIIIENNEVIFPKPGRRGKCRIYIGDHVRKRMEERDVSEEEILDGVFGAYKDMDKKFREGEIIQTYNADDCTVIITDARKNRINPVCLALFIKKSDKKHKLDNPKIIIKTVYKGGDFSGTMRKDGIRKGRYETKIFLY